ncbi:MAG TPA: GGDEF domain-containing protein [Thermoleophilaceae bacterium]|nr:GGDEF domain-containing protein [Thermoleophilaceae bacterium]
MRHLDKTAGLEERKTMAYSAAAIYLGAIIIAGVESAIPGGPQNSLVPGIVALVAASVAIVAGPRLPRLALAVFAPIGVATIAYALAETSGGPTDGAVLYMWPVLWMSYFYGRAGAVFIVAFVALAQGIALLSMPADQVSIDRWIDVVASVTVVAAVVRYLAGRNSRLVTNLEEQARIDPLTGLLNRRGLDERMDVEVRRALRADTSMAVAIFDIDHFKDVNDEHGHEVGDRVLSWVGGVLAQETRGVDAAARSGGDEFMVLMADTDARAGCLLAERVRNTLTSPEARADRRRHGVPEALELTVSAGIAGAGARDAGQLVEAADKALYVAKGDGRNRVESVDYAALPDTHV